ncbi:MAG: response regulator, partial [Myxococcales bacterium]|nr:response regulator [Myxococcales bacterium]
LRNLLDNAIKFTERGEVTVRSILDGKNKDGVQVRFEIVDSGVGIDPSHHEAIFEPFVQQDGSSTRRHGGTGLGLAIVKCTATLMGGSVEIDSQPGNGSKFSVLLPFNVVQGSTQSSDETRPLKKLLDHSVATSEHARVDGGLRVLVAEDNPVSQRLILSALVNRGHHPHLVEDGRAAVDAAASERFDLVLMDMTLPVLDGFSSAAVIRQKERQSGSRVPIVGMTDPPTVPDDLRFRAAGLDAGMAKPIDGDALATLLEKLQESARSRDLAKRFASLESPLVEIQQLMEEAGGDIETLAKLSQMFVESRAELLKPLEIAIDEQNSGRLAHAAHELTGTLRSMAGRVMQPTSWS